MNVKDCEPGFGTRLRQDALQANAAFHRQSEINNSHLEATYREGDFWSSQQSGC